MIFIELVWKHPVLIRTLFILLPAVYLSIRASTPPPLCCLPTHPLIYPHPLPSTVHVVPRGSDVTTQGPGILFRFPK